MKLGQVKGRTVPKGSIGLQTPPFCLSAWILTVAGSVHLKPALHRTSEAHKRREVFVPATSSQPASTPGQDRVPCADGGPTPPAAATELRDSTHLE